MRRADGGDASRRTAAGARPGRRRVCLPEHPLPPGRGGPGAGPAAADLRGAVLPGLRHGPAAHPAHLCGGRPLFHTAGGGIPGAAPLLPHGRPAAGHGGGGGRHRLRRAHEPAGAGRCGLGQDHGGGLRGVAGGEERRPVRPDGPHGAAGRAALPLPGPAAGAGRGAGGPAHRLGEGEGPEGALRRPGGGGSGSGRRHPRPVERGGGVFQPGPGDHRRAAPLRRGPARGPGRQGRADAPRAGHVRHPHPPHPGPHHLWGL